MTGILLCFIAVYGSNRRVESLFWSCFERITLENARFSALAAIFSCLRKKKFSGAIFCEKLRSLYPVQGQRSMDLTTSGDHMV